MINQISKIKNHIIFKDFKWLSALPDFNEKNVIYGWNGSGKTTLSNIFRSVEKNRNIEIGEVEFLINQQLVEGAKLEDEVSLPSIKVFNKKFVEDNVFTSSGSVTPIYYLGQESKEKQQEIEELGRDLKETKEDIRGKIDEIERVQKDRNSLLVDNANDIIKPLLRSSGSNNPYNNYNKNNFERKLKELEDLDEEELSKKILSEDNFIRLKQLKEATSKTQVPSLSSPFSEFNDIYKALEKVLQKTVASSALDELKDDDELSSWTRKGLSLHKERSSEKCLFCNNKLEAERVQELEGHFNDAYNAFISEIDHLAEKIKSNIERIERFDLFSKSDLYEHLQDDYLSFKNSFEEHKKQVLRFLKALRELLIEKRGKPFESMELSIPLMNINTAVLDSINGIIENHNKETENFERSIREARLKLEESIAAKKLEIYIRYNSKEKELVAKKEAETEKTHSFIRRIEELEKEIIGHRKPAEELNNDLKSYLGREELTFEPLEAGYTITRNGEVAENLSEGEKTAIAFLYFLKSLNDKDFKLEESIVVIDDPISSLDSNSLFHAFGFMRAYTEDAKQLFILTHNHSFFRQVKNWFNHLKHQGKSDIAKPPARFYMINIAQGTDGERTSKITKLDRLLHEYDSEYNYLFSVVKKGAASVGGNELQTYYHFPNIARRLLEGFLAFKKPNQNHSFQNALDSIDFDVAKKNQIIRFLHTNSHNDLISEPEHDHSILIETPAVLNNVLELIKDVDEDHYEEMVKCVDKKL